MSWLSFRKNMGHVRNANAYPSFRAPLTSSLHLLNGDATPTFSRTTTGTVVDFEGIVNTAKIDESRFEGARRVENKIDDSEDFSNWNLVGAEITTNDAIAPNGTLTADRVTATNISSGTYKIIDVSDSHFWAIYAKAGNVDFIYLRTNNSPTYDTFFNIRDGTVGTSSSEHTATIQDAGNGWYRCIVKSSVVNNRFNIVVAENDGDTSPSVGNYVHIWGAQLEEVKGTQTEASEYVSTDVPVSQGKELVVNGGFDTDSDWSKGAAWTISDGKANAATGFGTTFLEQANIMEVGKTYTVEYTVSDYSGTGNIGWSATVFDVVSGVSQVQTNGTFKFTAVSKNTTVRLFGLAATSYKLDNVTVKEEFFHGANVDSVKYFDIDRSGNPISSEILKGYLVEEQRTNQLLNSERLSGSGWAPAGLLIDIDDITAPDGTLTADKIRPTAVSTSHFMLQNSSVIVGNTYTQSLFVKATGYNFVQIFASGGFDTLNSWANFDLTDGSIGNVGSAVGTTKIESLGDDWFRISYTDISINSTSQGRFGLMSMPTDAVTRNPTFTGDGTSGCYFWGAQLEEGSFPSSYIKTEATTITRTADSLSYGVEDIKQGEGSIVVEFNQLGIDAGFHRFIELSDGTENNEIGCLAQPIQQIRYLVINSAVVQAAINTSSGAYNYNESNKIGISYSNNNINGFLNGILEGSDTSATIPNNIDTIDIGTSTFVTEKELNGNIKNVNIFKRKIPDSEMIRKTI